MTDSQNPIRLGLIGAGIFAKEAHIPAALSLKNQFEIVAIYSRSAASIEAANAMLSEPAAEYYDVDDLLRRDDIEAVDMLLPIYAMPDVVRKALAAGKHVISEKPIAPTVSTGRELLDFYRQNRRTEQVWMVAENYRYLPTVVRAAEIMQSGVLGDLMMCSWSIYREFDRDNRFYQSPWRRDGSHPGGFLLDGGIHFIATLRAVLGEVAAVNAFAGQRRDDLPPLDTMTAALQYESGLVGTLSVTYAAGAPGMAALTIAGERGVLQVSKTTMTLILDGEIREDITTDDNGIAAEFSAFYAAVRDGAAHRNTPAEALRDLAVLEAILQAAESGSRVSPQRIET